MGEKRCFSCVNQQEEITKSLMTIETTSKTGNNQNWVGKCEKGVSKPIKSLVFL